MDYRENIVITLAKYSKLKQVYIECEETDPELKTNLQPLNEFRAALDHVMKLWLAQVRDDDEEVLVQFQKLNAHLDRAFYDVCDMLSINYRNKIRVALEAYPPNVISAVLPDYYASTRPEIERISSRIVKYRNEKGTYGSYSEETLQGFDSYAKDVLYLKEAHQTIIPVIPEMERIQKEAQATTEENRHNTSKENLKNQIIGGVIGFIASLLLNLIFRS